jgi:hypothetical protein
LSNQTYSFAINGDTIGSFDWFSTFGPPYVGPKLSQLQKGTRYNSPVICYNASYSSSETLPPDDAPDIVGARAADQSGAPQNLKISFTPQHDALEATWSPPLDAGLGLLEIFAILYYSLECSTHSNFSQILGISNVSGSTLSTSIQGFTVGNSYFCRV